MILDEIVEYKREELEDTKTKQSIKELKRAIRDLPPPLNLYNLFISGGGGGNGKTRIIAEIKKASPSKGLLCPSFNLLSIGRIYVQNGACAISVLTERRFFQGDLAFLSTLKKEFNLPLLRKDFILEEYQIYESLLSGADAVLLIVKILKEGKLRDLVSLAHELNLTPVVEVHDRDDLEKALASGTRLIGINNRDLDTFEVDLNTTYSLLPFVPEGYLVISESGINKRKDILLLEEKGVDGFLIGEALLRERDIGAKLKELIGNT